MFFRSTLIAHKTARKPYFMGLVVHKEIIFRKREYQEYITPQNFGSGVFFYLNCGIIIKYDKKNYLKGVN